MRKLLIALLLVSFFAAGADAQTKSRRRVPKPIFKGKPAVSKTAPKQEKPVNHRLTIEKHVSNYDINRDGTARQVWESRQRCFSEACTALIRNFKYEYNGDLQQMRALDVHIEKANGTKIPLPESAVRDKPTDQAAAAPGFSSLREIEFAFDGIEPGDAIYLKLEILTTKATFDGHFSTVDYFPPLLDWKSVEINISAPGDYPIYLAAEGLDGGRLADENGRSRWQYRQENIPTIEVEPAMLDVMSISPRLELTTFKTFDELGAVFWEELNRKAVVTPEIKAIADDITKGIDDPKQQASAIYDWANKNIRYLSIVLDRGGWVPHSSAEIVANRYGDCKDYTTIIHTLLKAKGIESVPVLIRSDFGDWFPKIASPDYFNHAILYIPSMNLFADATAPNTRLGLISQTLVGKKALLAGAKTGIIEVPKDNPAENQIISDVTVEFSDNGTLKARTRNTYAGRSEIMFRPLFGTSTEVWDSANFGKILLAYLGLEGDGRMISIGNPHKVGEPFIVEFEAEIGDFGTFMSGGKAFVPVGINMLNPGFLEQLTTPEKRTTSLAAGATILRENFLVKLPTGVTAISPKPVLFSNAAGTFNLSFEVKESQLKVTRELTIAKDFISPEEYPLFKELVRSASGGQMIEFAYRTAPAVLKAKTKQPAPVPAKKTGSETFEELVYSGKINESFKPLRPAEVRRLESRIVADENDIEARMRLLRHYWKSGIKKSPAIRKAHLKHRLWMVRNRPEIGESSIYGWDTAEYPLDSDEYIQLKAAWLAQLEADPKNRKIRLSAVDFIKSNEPPIAEKLILAGAELEPGDYSFPMLLAESEFAEFEEFDDGDASAAKKETAQRLLNHGRKALALIKTERSDQRDADRYTVLKYLCRAALAAAETEAAESFAKELILDFGQSSHTHGYDEAAHLGNVTLGLVELRRNNVEKAKEHLLSSIRAPLRMNYNSLSKIDTELAKDLYKRGEKETVVEYLKLCLELGNLKEYPISYEIEIEALKLWQEQISNGITPSFDFKAP